jgi:hypothetical protein
MVAPDVLPGTTVVYRWLGPGLTSEDETYDWALLLVVEAFMLQQEPVEQVVRHRDGRVGWETALDPDNAPAETLGWLAQWVGARLEPKWSVAAQRVAIKKPVSWRRGTPEAIRTAAEPWLHRGRVRIVERDGGDQWAITVEYYAGQLEGFTLDELDADFATLDQLQEGFHRLDDLDGNAEELEAAVIAATPAWLVPTVTQHPGALLDDIDEEFASLDAVDAEFATLDEMAAHVPASMLE